MENNDIPEMNLDKKYSPQNPIVPQNTSEAQKEMEKTKNMKGGGGGKQETKKIEREKKSLK